MRLVCSLPWTVRLGFFCLIVGFCAGVYFSAHRSTAMPVMESITGATMANGRGAEVNVDLSRSNERRSGCDAAHKGPRQPDTPSK
jgi:hypothetical protein